MPYVIALFCCVICFCRPVYADYAGPYTAQVNRVIDGDTLDVNVQLWPGLTQQVSVRIRGVDTPELKGATQCERDLATQARTFVVNALLNLTKVTIVNVKFDKFAGRVDAEVFIGDASLGDVLLLAGFAKPYTGGKRLPWCV